MRRKTFDALMATGGLVLAIILVVAGGLLVWAHSFADTSVRTQLVQQKIDFPAKGSPSLKADPEITKYVTPYAGQQVVNGQQAAVFANHYIAVHMRGIAAGQTYSEVSGQYIALQAQNPNDPKLAALSGQRQALFMGETLRGMLLNAYAFWKLGQIAAIAAIASFITAGLMFLLSALGFWHLRRVAPEAVVLPNLGAHTPAPVEV
ncbi:MAG: hypothetical protein QOF18_1694 [Frankiaceae bacterium]|jgi:hypothetical protein|nr:hypothetical protein [Frankiaceae bacterium]